MSQHWENNRHSRQGEGLTRSRLSPTIPHLTTEWPSVQDFLLCPIEGPHLPLFPCVKSVSRPCCVFGALLAHCGGSEKQYPAGPSIGIGLPPCSPCFLFNIYLVSVCVCMCKCVHQVHLVTVKVRTGHWAAEQWWPTL